MLSPPAANQPQPKPRPTEKLPTKLFVGQIPEHCSQGDLLRLFGCFGEVTELVILPRGSSSSRCCCGFVVYARSKHAKQAQQLLSRLPCKLTKSFLQRMSQPSSDSPMSAAALKSLINKHKNNASISPLRVKLASHQLPKNTQPNPHNKLFVSNLGPHTTEQDIAPLFERFGTVREVVVLRSKGGRSKQCSLVQYESREQAEDAIKSLNAKHRIHENLPPLQVRWKALAPQKPPQRTPPKQPSHPYPSRKPDVYPWGHYESVLIPSIPPPAPAADPIKLPASHAPSAAEEEHTSTHAGLNPFAQSFQQPPIYMHQWFPVFHSFIPNVEQTEANLHCSNFPSRFTNWDLFALFSRYGQIISYVIHRQQKGSSQFSFAFVSYYSAECAKQAIQGLHRFEIEGKKLKVSIKRQERKRRHREPQLEASKE